MLANPWFWPTAIFTSSATWRVNMAAQRPTDRPAVAGHRQAASRYFEQLPVELLSRPHVKPAMAVGHTLPACACWASRGLHHSEGVPEEPLRTCHVGRSHTFVSIHRTMHQSITGSGNPLSNIPNAASRTISVAPARIPPMTPIIPSAKATKSSK